MISRTEVIFLTGAVVLAARAANDQDRLGIRMTARLAPSAAGRERQR